MYKKLIVIAVGTALGMPVVQAGVEIYGQARMSVDFNSNGTPGLSTACSTATPPVATACKDSALSLSSNRSRIGFRGDENLGSGLKALWQLEHGLDFDVGTWGPYRRDSFVGLGGTFGTIQLGYLNTPYKMSTQVMDIFNYTRGDYNALLGTVNSTTHQFDVRFANAIQYRTPDGLGGFRAVLSYSVNNADDDLPVTTTDSKKDAFSLNGSYTQGPLYLTAAYESLNARTLSAGVLEDAIAWKVGGSFTVGGATTLAAVWESADLGGTGNNGARDAYHLNLAHKLNGLTLKAAFTKADETDGVADTGAIHWAVGAAYALTKTTEASVVYSVVSNDPAGRYSIDLVSGPGINGKDISSISVGLNHVFSSK